MDPRGLYFKALRFNFVCDHCMAYKEITTSVEFCTSYMCIIDVLARSCLDKKDSLKSLVVGIIILATSNSVQENYFSSERNLKGSLSQVVRPQVPHLPWRVNTEQRTSGFLPTKHDGLIGGLSDMVI